MSVLEVDLLTGRKHQVRVQLAHIGLPIWGDEQYGQYGQHPISAAVSAAADNMETNHSSSSSSRCEKSSDNGTRSGGIALHAYSLKVARPVNNRDIMTFTASTFPSFWTNVFGTAMMEQLYATLSKKN